MTSESLDEKIVNFTNNFIILQGSFLKDMAILVTHKRVHNILEPMLERPFM
jgi:hypothetical protein